MLALFAAKPYSAPTSDDGGEIDLDAHLTNTCLQTGKGKGGDAVRLFWDLPMDGETKEAVWGQIRSVTGEIFEAAAKGMMGINLFLLSPFLLFLSHSHNISTTFFSLALTSQLLLHGI